MLAPANGWFEWVKDPADPKKKQPYFITLKEQAPMFFAGLAEVHQGLDTDPRDGFVIITAASSSVGLAAILGVPLIRGSQVIGLRIKLYSEAVVIDLARTAGRIYPY